MHPATPSIRYFGMYVVLTGAALVAAPGMLMSPLGIAPPTEIWVRVLGVLALVVGYYYLACARGEAVAFYRATVAGRLGFAGLIVLLVILYSAPVQLVLFGLADVAGAIWTSRGLRRSARG